MTQTVTLELSYPYHLGIGLSLALILILSLSYRTLAKSQMARRWSLAASSLLFLRFLILVVAILGWRQGREAGALLASLSPFAGLAGVLFIGWAALFPRRSGPVDLGLVAALLLCLVGLVSTLLLAALATQGTPNTIDLLWSAATLLACLVIGFALLVRRPGQWAFYLTGFVLLAAAHGALAAIRVWQGSTASLASVFPLVEVIAYSLFALGAARGLAMERIKVEVRRGEVAASAKAGIGVSSELLGDVFGLGSAVDRSDLAARATRTIARALHLEYCLMLTPPDPSGELVIATGYDLLHEQDIPGASVDVKRMPEISAALSRRRVLTLPGGGHSPDTLTLQKTLGTEHLGPALLVPITFQDELYGGILTLSPSSREGWSDEERAALERIALHVAIRLDQLQHFGAATADAEGTLSALAHAYSHIESLTQENERLTRAIALAGGDPAVLPTDVAGLLATQQEAQETIRILEAEIERLKAAQVTPFSGTAEEAELLTNRLQAVLQELAAVRARLRVMEEGAATPANAVPVLDVGAIGSLIQELRLPLSSVSDCADLMLGDSVGPLAPTQRRLLESVRNGVKHIGILLADLSQIAAIETKTAELARAPVNVAHCAEHALVQTQASLEAGKHTVRLDIPDDLPAVLGDQDAITLILVHLIYNAAGASPEGSEIIVSTQEQVRTEGGKTGFVSVACTDAGPGIRPEDLGQVFQRPDQLGRPIFGLGNTGIGLAVVRTLAEALGGRVWAEGQPGAGSTIVVLLPAAQRQPSLGGPAQAA
jgi:signal transduction histidine kinase